jgi:hypothetical protein
MKRWLPLLGILTVLSCSTLENPFDPKSPNYVGDGDLRNYIGSDTTTRRDTVLVIDTLIKIDTIRIPDGAVVFDTVLIIDTILITEPPSIRNSKPSIYWTYVNTGGFAEWNEILVSVEYQLYDCEYFDYKFTGTINGWEECLHCNGIVEEITLKGQGYNDDKYGFSSRARCVYPDTSLWSDTHNINIEP